MRGKRAKELRRAARMLAGPRADWGDDYTAVQQYGPALLGAKPVPPRWVLRPGYSNETEEGRRQIEAVGLGAYYTDAAGRPVCLTTGYETRLAAGCGRAIYQALKRHYAAAHKRLASSRFVMRRTA